MLRSLLLILDAKVSAIEEIKDLDSLTINELHGILMVYKMRIEKENPSKKEVSFKASKKKNKREHEGKIPIKFFNFGKVGHFVDKCPYAKDESSDDEEKNNIKKGRKHHQ